MTSHPTTFKVLAQRPPESATFVARQYAESRTFKTDSKTAAPSEKEWKIDSQAESLANVTSIEDLLASLPETQSLDQGGGDWFKTLSSSDAVTADALYTGGIKLDSIYRLVMGFSTRFKCKPEEINSLDFQKFFLQRNLFFPATKEFKDFFDPKPPQIVVTYSWQHVPLWRIWATLRKTLGDNVTVWIDIFCVNQIRSKLGLALPHIEKFYSSVPSYYVFSSASLSRGWCLFELANRVKSGLSLPSWEISEASVKDLVGKYKGFDFYGSMECAFESDLNTIKERVMEVFGSSEKFNALISQSLMQYHTELQTTNRNVYQMVFGLKLGDSLYFRGPHAYSANKLISLNQLFLDLCNVYTAVDMEEICSDQTCPVMNGGPQVDYLWQEFKVGSNRNQKPEKVSASEYVKRLFAWVDSCLHDPVHSVFPTTPHSPVPRQAPQFAAKIIARLFRVYVHMFHAHFKRFEEVGGAAYLFDSFRYFAAFQEHFRLIPKKELAPLQDLLDKWSKPDLG
eukprot:gb/GEZN01005390.1/.p1 GENE.gb/GEZN01005390.1/~~gb/GEZN01005390.1/.p1  ORF type:complete len:510 (+),score=57.87 gb/GEZN01005390.1/:53-1582(+)